jgi:hypothetical protein
MRRIVIALLLSAAVPAFAAPKALAPATIPHPVAMFLASVAADGKTKVTFTATARGKYFFFEEQSGVTVYTYDGADYRKSEFLKSYTLAKALKKYSGR